MTPHGIHSLRMKLMTYKGTSKAHSPPPTCLRRDNADAAQVNQSEDPDSLPSPQRFSCSPVSKKLCSHITYDTRVPSIQNLTLSLLEVDGKMRLACSMRPTSPTFSTWSLCGPFPGCFSLAQPGGKLAMPRSLRPLACRSFHLTDKLSTPSLSSGMLVLRTQSMPAFSSPSLSLFNSIVPPGVHKPPCFNLSHPCASGTAPQSIKKWTRSLKSISAGGSLNSSSH